MGSRSKRKPSIGICANDCNIQCNAAIRWFPSMSIPIPSRRHLFITIFASFISSCGQTSTFHRDLATNDSLIASEVDTLTEAKIDALLSIDTVCLLYASPNATPLDQRLQAILSRALAEDQTSSAATKITIFQLQGSQTDNNWFNNALIPISNLVRSVSPDTTVTIFQVDHSEFINRLKCDAQDGMVIASQHLFFYHDSVPDALITGQQLRAPNMLLIVVSRHSRNHV